MTYKLLLSPVLLLALGGPATQSAVASMVVVVPGEDAAYAAGTKALNESRWADAVAAFEKVVNSKGNKADAALYWKAYALNKLDKRQLASSTCDQLRSQFRDSTWNKDCDALSVSGRDNNHEDVRSDIAPSQRDIDRDARTANSRSNDPDTEIKILALNSLLHRDPAQAVPLLRAMLTSDRPARMKQHALFVLAQSKSPEADLLMRDLLAGKMGVDLQVQAIRSNGIYHGKAANDSLADIYRNATDPQVKEAVISAFFISGDDTRLVEIARQEKNLEAKRRIVSQISLMRGKAATDYMMELLK